MHNVEQGMSIGEVGHSATWTLVIPCSALVIPSLRAVRGSPDLVPSQTAGLTYSLGERGQGTLVVQGTPRNLNLPAIEEFHKVKVDFHIVMIKIAEVEQCSLWFKVC